MVQAAMIAQPWTFQTLKSPSSLLDLDMPALPNRPVDPTRASCHSQAVEAHESDTSGQRRRWFRQSVAWLFLLALMVGPVPEASAQWGWGYGGWGMWGGGAISNAAMFENINARSAAAANAAYVMRQNMPGAGNVYRGNPNAYINNVRDTTFFERFDPSTRRSIAQQVSRNPERGLASLGLNNPPAPAAPSRPVIDLASFFSGAGVLVWPSEAPTNGELGEKQKLANAATQSVFQEVKSHGRAPVGLVSDARTQLVAYGRPALNYLREHTTAAVVDAFHRFLLGLYDAVGRAAQIQNAAPTR